MTQFIFDSNYYRNQVTDKNKQEFNEELRIQKKIEKERNLKVLFSNIVAIELISHLHDQSRSAEICFNSLGYLTNHASDIIEDRIKGTVVTTFHDLLTLYFFNQTSKHFTFNSNLVQLTHLIAFKYNNEALVKWESKISEVIQFKEGELKNIIENIENYYLKSFSETGVADWRIFETNKNLRNEFAELKKNKSFHKLFALSLVQLAVRESLSEKVEIEIKDIEQFSKDFKVSIDFFIDKIWNSLGLKDSNKKHFYDPKTRNSEKWNSLYDMQLIFAVEYEIAKGRNTILVTNEKKILELFQKHKLEDNAINPQTYKEKYLF